MTTDLIFHCEQNGAWLNYQYSHSKQATLKRSAFAGCYSVAQWWSVWAIWGLNRSLAGLGMAVSSCTTLWCWRKVSAVNFPLFQPIAFHNPNHKSTYINLSMLRVDLLKIFFLEFSKNFVLFLYHSITMLI